MDTRYCYHCQTYHPQTEMRLVTIRARRRWRCTKSLAAARAPLSVREAFGQQTTRHNREDARQQVLRVQMLMLAR